MTHNLILWITLGTALGSLMYSHLLYPLLMAFWARGARVTSLGEEELPSVSLIIPAHNEVVVIEAKLKNAMSMDYPHQRLEIIVASDGSTDDTVRLASRFEDRGVRVLDLQPRRGKASVLNDAVEAATHEVICLCDANVMFDPQALRRMTAPLADDHIGAVTGDVRLMSERSSFGAGESLYYRIERAVQQGESRLSSTICVDGGMYVMRRHLFVPLAADTILDDFTTTMNVLREGHRVVYEPLAQATENETPSARLECRRRARVMRGAVQALFNGHVPRWSQPVLMWEFVSHKLLRWLSPPLLLVILASSVWLSGESRLSRWLVGGQAAFYGIALLAAVFPRLRRLSVVGVIFYFCLSHAAMFGGLWEGLFSRPQGTWERTQRSVMHSAQPRFDKNLEARTDR